MKHYAYLLHDQCVVAEGGQIADLGAFVSWLSALMAKSLHIHPEYNPGETEDKS